MITKGVLEGTLCEDLPKPVFNGLKCSVMTKTFKAYIKEEIYHPQTLTCYTLLASIFSQAEHTLQINLFNYPFLNSLKMSFLYNE